MTSPRNTSEPDRVDLELMLIGGSGAIEAQEAQGQRELLQATTLPSDTRGRDTEFEALGFKFGDVVPNDRLFRETTLPAGWSKQGTDHAMHTRIVDERGIERVSVFYKAAFYDRRADMMLVNVGYAAAQTFIYGDDQAAALNQLTADELADARTAAVEYTERADIYPDIYGDQLPRAWKLIAAVDEAVKA